MKKSTIEKIEKEIETKTSISTNIKMKIKKNIITNIVICAIIVLYIIFMFVGSKGSLKNVRAIDLNIFSFLFLITAIALFEIAYKKDNGYIAVHGIEALVIAVCTLFLPYIIFELSQTYSKYYCLISIVFVAIYYFIKSIIVFHKIKNNYIKEISDIKEIVKKEKTRKIKEDIEQIEENEIVEKNNDIKKDKEKKSSSSNRKRGRPKKAENKIEEDIPKKRGRPRKVVTRND